MTKQITLATWLKGTILGISFCAALIYAAIVPMLGETMVSVYPEFSSCRWPWLLLIWATAVPCGISLVFAWKIAVNIGKGDSFSTANAELLRKISILAALDALIFFAGNLAYWLLNINHPSIVLFSLLVEFFCVAISIVAAGLSYLARNAAVLQVQSDLTI